MRLRLVSALALALALAPVTAAGAATIAPSTTADVVANDGQCSLREAITAARIHAASGSLPGECPAGTGSDVISLAPGHYLLSIEGAKEDANASGDLDIGSDLTIKGTGASSTFIETNRPDRVIQILTGVTATIEGVTVTGGRSPVGGAGESVTGEPTSRGKEGTAGEPGGGIFNQGTLTLQGSVVSGNSTGQGGNGGSGTGNPGGNGVGGNAGEGGAGGGIASTGPLTVLASTISGNSTGAGGVGGAGFGSAGGLGGAGGFAVGGGGGNGGAGGGIESSGPLTLTRSTVSGNATGGGGRAGGAFGGSGESGTGPFGGYAIGGISGSGGGGGGLTVRATFAITESTIANNRTGAGALSGIGTGGAGGPGVGAGAGGVGGEGSAGIGGAGGSGGGIDGGFSAAGEINRSAITGNVTGDGGAGNSGSGGAGGAGGSGGGAGGNGGKGAGGLGGTGGLAAGVALAAPSLILKNTTIAGNAAGAGGAGGDGVGGSGGLGKGGGANGTGGEAAGVSGGSGGSAGGVFLGFEERATLTQDTISGNATGAGGASGAALPGSPGGGGFVEGPAGNGTGEALSIQSGAVVTLADTIVASGTGPNCVGTATDGGHDISFPDASCPGANVNPQLGSLQDNGGPTPTEALPAGSPAVDAVPAVEAGCEPTDQRGALRPAGGACDIGAFELATPTALTGAVRAVATTAATVTGVARNPDLGGASAFFQYGTSTAYGLHTASQPVGAITPGSPFAATFAALAPGTTYHYRAVVTNAAGAAFGVDRTFTTAGVPLKPAKKPPLLGSLVIRPSSLLPDRGRGASITRRHPAKRGATVSYTDTQPALTTFTVQRQVSGYRVGRLCAAKRPAHRKGRVRRCTRYVTVGSFSHTDKRGSDSFHFTGRVKGRALAKGRYQLVAVPRAGGLTGAPDRAAFKIV